MTRSPEQSSDVIGLIPAAGWGRRLGNLPCSKEVFPLGIAPDDEAGLRPKVACQYLLDRFQAAHIRRAFVVIRPGKWDIPAFFGDGSESGMHLAYLMMGHPFGSPFSIDQAFPFIENNRIALGYPDVLLKPNDAYGTLLDRQERTGADVVLGLFPTDNPKKTDMVETDAAGRVTQINIKPDRSTPGTCWVMAVWTPQFTRYLHDHLARLVQAARKTGAMDKLENREFYVGNVLQAWLAEGLPVEAETFPGGRWLDIGTPQDLARARLDFAT